ncbi:MAG: LacI family DNA-binding transcriptional regulator [Rhizobiaceae bacterium]
MNAASRPKVTSHDVARAAGVSRTTVSMVLSGSTAVVLADETRLRVKEAAERLGYRPNSAGRMLASGASKTIGLIVSNPDLLLVDGFIPPTLYAISKIATEQGYNVLVESLPDAKDERAYADLVLTRRIDGMIVLNPRTEDPQLAALIERNFPIVLLGTIRHPKEVTVNIPGTSDLQEAVDYLVGIGHKKIGHIAISRPGSNATDYRIVEFREALQEHGLSLPDEQIAYGDFSAASGYDAALALLKLKPDITAILAGNDTIALGVMRAARDFGMSLPGDLSVIGYDDLPFAAFLEPPLTTIRSKPVEQGEAATRMLIDLMQGRPAARPDVDLATKFIKRGSCAAPRSRPPLLS